MILADLLQNVIIPNLLRIAEVFLFHFVPEDFRFLLVTEMSNQAIHEEGILVLEAVTVS